MDKEYIVAGFKFKTENEYNAAKKEQETIKYLEDRLDLSNIKMVLTLYNKIVETNSLKTIIGKCFMKKLYDLLDKSEIINSEEIPIIVAKDDTKDGNKVFYRTQYRTKYKEDKTLKKELDKAKNSLASWRMLAIVFAVVISIMFYIVLNSDSSTYTNAKEAILDEYSEWENELSKKEQSLQEREQILEEKERSIQQEQE